MTEQEVHREFERCAAEIARRIPTLCDYPEPIQSYLSKLTAFDVLRWAADTYAVHVRTKVTLVQAYVRVEDGTKLGTNWYIDVDLLGDGQCDVSLRHVSTIPYA